MPKYKRTWKTKPNLTIYLLCYFAKNPILFKILKYFIARKLKWYFSFREWFSCLKWNIFWKNADLGDTKFIDYWNIYIEEWTKFSYYNKVVTSSHDITNYPENFSDVVVADIHIGKNCRITTNCLILPWVNIWDNTIIWSWSVVVNDIPWNCIAVWNPCKLIKYLK